MHGMKNFFPLIFAAVLTVVPGAPLFFFDPKTGVTWAAFVFLLAVYVFVRKRIDTVLVLAMLFALFTNIVNDYTYTTFNLIFFGVNLFSFVSWTAGLVLLREVYDYFNFRFKWIVISITYLALLILFEYIGFHHLGIELDNDYGTLLGLGVIHGPPIMHIFYPSAGPVYLLLTEYVPKYISRAAFFTVRMRNTS